MPAGETADATAAQRRLLRKRARPERRPQMPTGSHLAPPNVLRSVAEAARRVSCAAHSLSGGRIKSRTRCRSGSACRSGLEDYAAGYAALDLARHARDDHGVLAEL